MEHISTSVFRVISGVKTVFQYTVLCISAVLASAVLSVLFLAAEVPGESSGEAKDIILAWKPAYVFSIPEEGELVVYETEQTISDTGRLAAVSYDSDMVRMEQVRGKVIFRIPGNAETE